MKKTYCLVYRKDDEFKRLFESESLEKVEAAKIDFSFDYNTDFLSIEEIYVGRTINREKEEEEKKPTPTKEEEKGWPTLILSLLSLISILTGIYLKKHNDGK